MIRADFRAGWRPARFAVVEVRRDDDAAGERVLEHLFEGDALVVEGGLVRAGEDDVGEVFSRVVVQASDGVGSPPRGVGFRIRGVVRARERAVPGTHQEGPGGAAEGGSIRGGARCEFWARRGGGDPSGTRSGRGRRGKTHGAVEVRQPRGERADRRGVGLVLDEGSEDGVSMVFRRGASRSAARGGAREDRQGGFARGRDTSRERAGNENLEIGPARDPGRAARETRAHLPLRPSGRARCMFESISAPATRVAASPPRARAVGCAIQRARSNKRAEL